MLDKKTILHFLQVELEFRQNQIRQFRKSDHHILAYNLNKNIDPARYIYFLDLLHEYGAGSADYYVAWLKNTIVRVENEVTDNNNPFNFEQAVAV